MTSVTTTHKRLSRWGLMLCFATALPASAQSGLLVQSFDDPSVLGSWKQTSSDPGYMVSTNTTDPVEGTGATVFTFDFVADAGADQGDIWGGAVSLTGEGDGFDLSAHSGLQLRYKTTDPIDEGAPVHFMLKLVDASTGELELWELHRDHVLTDTSGEWQVVRFPFESFTLPSWLAQGDGSLDLDEIVNWEMQVRVDSSGAGNTYSGEIHVDELSVYTDAILATEVESFDDHSVLGSWKNSSSEPGYTLETTTEEPFAGTGATVLDYEFIADAGSEEGIWGGSVVVAGPGGGFDFEGYTGLSLRYKVIEPIEPGSAVSLAFKLIDTSHGDGERWELRVPQVVMDTTGEWQQVVLPFQAFELPGWVPQGNGILDLDEIANWQIEVIASSDGAQQTYTGEVQFDNLMLYTAAVIGRTVQDFDTHTRLGSWKNTSSEPGITLSTTSEAFQGTGALAMEYAFVADAGAESGNIWGGSVDVAGEGTGYDFSGNNGLALRYRVVDPVEPDVDVSFAFKLVDVSDGVEEYWELRRPEVIKDQSGEWQQVLLPFNDFVLPSHLNNRGNERLDLDEIVNWQFQVIAGSAGANMTYSGEVHFDALKVGRFGSAGPEGPGILSEFSIVDGAFVDTDTWMGWLEVMRYPWVYSFSLEGYLLVPHTSSVANGAWMYRPIPSEFEGGGEFEGPAGPGALSAFPLEDGVFVNTLDWMGWLQVGHYPWAYSFSLETYVYILDTSVSLDSGGWIYFPRF